MKERKYPHYYKDVSNLNEVDVYRVLKLFNVTDQAIGHAIKKLLVAGGRGAKDISKDVQEAIDTLERWKEIQGEDSPVCAVGPVETKFGTHPQETVKTYQGIPLPSAEELNDALLKVGRAASLGINVSNKLEHWNVAEALEKLGPLDGFLVKP